MSSNFARTRTGTIHASEMSTIFNPRNPRTGRYPLIVGHGAGVPDTFSGGSWPNAVRIAKECANAGIPVAAHMDTANPNTPVDLWANTAHLQRITDAYNAFGAAKVHLLGVSMFGGAAYQWAAANPSKVASIMGIIPMASLIGIYQRNPGSVPSAGFAPSIATAWGLAYTTVAAGATGVSVGSGSTALVAGSGTPFSSGMTGYNVIGVPGITPGTTMTFVDATHATLSAPATAAVTSLAAAFGQPLPAGADIVANAAAIKTAGIPCWLDYSTVDAYVLTSEVTALATASGATATAIDSTLGHTNGTLGEFGRSAYIQSLFALGG